MDDEIISIEASQPKSTLAPHWRTSSKTYEKALVEAKKMIPNANLASDAELEKLYDTGYKLYQSGRYKDAKYYFNLLTLAHVKEPRYMMARAACEQMLKEYHNAIISYSIAAILDPNNPFPHYYSVDCHLKKEDLLNASVSLKMTIKRCEGNPKFKVMKERSLALLDKVIQDLKDHKDPKVVKFLEKMKKQP